jgi:hypothetical protein
LEPDKPPLPESENDAPLEPDKPPLPESENDADGNEAVFHGLPVEESGHWREAREAALRKIAPIVATSKTPVELRILKRYLLAALGLLSVGILLTIMDERWGVAHVTAAIAVLMLGVVGISMVAIYRSRTIVEGLIRTTTPSVRDPDRAARRAVLPPAVAGGVQTGGPLRNTCLPGDHRCQQPSLGE